LLLAAGLMLATASASRAFTLVESQGFYFVPSDVGPGQSARAWGNNLFGTTKIGVQVTFLNARSFEIVNDTGTVFLPPQKGFAFNFLPAVQDQIGLVVIAKLIAPPGAVLEPDT